MNYTKGMEFVFKTRWAYNKEYTLVGKWNNYHVLAPKAPEDTEVQLYGTGELDEQITCGYIEIKQADSKPGKREKAVAKTEIHRDFAARVFKDECPLCFGNLEDGHCKDCGAAFTRERNKIYYIEGSCTQFKSNATKMRMMRDK